MDAEYFIIYCGSQWQKVKQIGELLPNLKTAIFALAFNLKSVDLSDLARLVIAAKQVESPRISEFEEDQVSDGLY